MFGTYRTILALFVVLDHIGGVHGIGAYAVFGFFALSGYLMTYIMQHNYGYTLRGITIYGFNRFLRIYPIYWVACLVAFIVLISLNPAATTGINPNFAIPVTVGDWLMNLGIVLKISSSPVLVYPAWALTVELFYYACIGLGLSRFKISTLIWFLASVAYTVFIVVIDASWDSWDSRYYSIFAASLPFSTGAMIYHWRQELADHFPFIVENKWSPLFLLGVIVCNWRLSTLVGIEGLWGFYVNWLLCSAMIVALYGRTQLLFVSRTFDSWLGNLSYPVYLVHYQVGFAMLYIYNQLGLVPQGQSVALFLYSVVPVLLLAWLMSVLVELPIERIRKRVKQSV
jgi:peptidoglycan/LPS O-acetylase OafA/YrhL